MSQNFSVLIVEDDFRVAEIHRQYVEKVNGFKVMDTVFMQILCMEEIIK